MTAVNAVDLGEGFGMPGAETPDKVLKSRRPDDAASREVRLRNICEKPGCDLDVANGCGPDQIYRNNQSSLGATHRHRRPLRLPCEVLEPTFGMLVRHRLRARTGDLLG